MDDIEALVSGRSSTVTGGAGRAAGLLMPCPGPVMARQGPVAVFLSRPFRAVA